MLRSPLIVVVLLLLGTAAHGDELGVDVEFERPWSTSIELAGRGGPWGVGVERALDRRWYAGTVVSLSLLRGDQLYTLAPYGGLRLLASPSGRHAWRSDLGLQIMHARTPSPVPEWDGVTHTGVGVALGSSYEYLADRWVFRTGLLVFAGKEGVTPWLSVSFGWRF